MASDKIEIVHGWTFAYTQRITPSTLPEGYRVAHLRDLMRGRGIGGGPNMRNARGLNVKAQMLTRSPRLKRHLFVPFVTNTQPRICLFLMPSGVTLRWRLCVEQDALSRSHIKVMVYSHFETSESHLGSKPSD